MKKSIIMLMISMFAFTALPMKDSRAGILIVSKNIANGNADAAIATAVGVGAILGGGVSLVGGVVEGDPGIAIGGALVMILGADAGLSNQALSAELNKSFPFIENGNTIAEIVISIKSKYEIMKDENGNAYVSLSEQELESILHKNEDLSTEEFSKVVTLLK